MERKILSLVILQVSALGKSRVISSHLALKATADLHLQMCRGTVSKRRDEHSSSRLMIECYGAMLASACPSVLCRQESCG
jgi:hypothetical protein